MSLVTAVLFLKINLLVPVESKAKKKKNPIFPLKLRKGRFENNLFLSNNSTNQVATVVLFDLNGSLLDQKVYNKNNHELYKNS